MYCTSIKIPFIVQFGSKFPTGQQGEPTSPLTSSSMKSSGFCGPCSAFLSREETKVEGVHPTQNTNAHSLVL